MAVARIFLGCVYVLLIIPSNLSTGILTYNIAVLICSNQHNVLIY